MSVKIRDCQGSLYDVLVLDLAFVSPFCLLYFIFLGGPWMTGKWYFTQNLLSIRHSHFVDLKGLYLAPLQKKEDCHIKDELNMLNTHLFFKNIYIDSPHILFTIIIY